MSKEERKGDPRIYVVTGLLFSCLITGGVLLSLYLCLPGNNVKTWYATTGMVLTGIPWLFWFFTYVYRCIRPCDDQCQPHEAFAYASPPPPHHMEAATPTAISSPLGDYDDEVGKKSPDGARHVHFGQAVVLRNDSEKPDGLVLNNAHEQGVQGHSGLEHDDSSCSVMSRESEKPFDFVWINACEM